MSFDWKDQLLDEIFGRLDEVIDLPIDRQAEFCDSICVDLVSKNPNLVKFQLPDTHNPHFEMWNVCSVGNLAYVSLNHPDPGCRVESACLLERYRIWYNSHRS